MSRNILKFEASPARMLDDATPAHVNPIEWQQSLGLARQIAARVFRDGGTPADALAAFGLEAKATAGWDKAVELIAEAMARTPAARRTAA